MGNVINTNVKALMASNALNKNGRVQQNVMESLSTGKSITVPLTTQLACRFARP